MPNHRGFGLREGPADAGPSPLHGPELVSGPGPGWKDGPWNPGKPSTVQSQVQISRSATSSSVTRPSIGVPRVSSAARMRLETVFS